MNNNSFGIEINYGRNVGWLGSPRYGIFNPFGGTSDPYKDLVRSSSFFVDPNRPDGKIRTSSDPNNPFINPLTDQVKSGRYLPLGENIGNNGVNYVNWNIAGAGTTKSASGIRLVDAGSTERARLQMAFKPDTPYEITVTIHATDMATGVTINNNLTGSFSGLPVEVGTHKLVLTTRKDLTTANNFLWFYIFGQEGKFCEFTLDSVYELPNYARTTTPKLVLTFDDGWTSQYTRAFDYMKTKNVKGTIYTIANALGTNNFITKSQLDEMYNDGWCVANHTLDHSYMGSADYETAKTIIKNGMDWLRDNGYATGINHIAYPGGQFNNNVLKACFDLGCLTGRTITLGNGSNGNLIADLFKVNTQTLGGGATTLAQAKTMINNAITNGSTELFMFHRIVDTLGEVGNDGMNILTADFNELIDYAVDSGIEIMTIDEWYQSLQIENPYWTGANILLQGFAQTPASGYKTETNNNKSFVLAQLDGGNDLGLMSGASAPNPTSGNFSFGIVVQTGANKVKYWLTRNETNDADTQYAFKMDASGNLFIILEGVAIQIGTALAVGLHAVWLERKDGVLTAEIDRVQTHTQAHTTTLTSRSRVAVGASHTGATTYTGFSNDGLGVMVYDDTDIPKSKSNYYKMIAKVYGL